MALARLSFLKSSSLLNEFVGGVEVTTFDTALKFLLESVSKFVDSYTGRNVDDSGSLESTTYTDELYNGNDTQQLWLNNYPVATLSAVKLWDDAADLYTTENAAYYSLIKGRYIQYPILGQTTSALWSYWRSTYHLGIKVTYTAGYNTGTTYAITGVHTTNETFTIAGDYTTIFTAGKLFDVISSTGNNGTWTVTSSSLVAGSTVIKVTGNITNATVDGTITASWSTASIANSLYNVPRDLEYAVAKLAALMWLEGRGGDGRLGITSKSVEVASSLSYEKFLSGMPPDVIEILKRYKKLPTP